MHLRFALLAPLLLASFTTPTAQAEILFEMDAFHPSYGSHNLHRTVVHSMDLHRATDMVLSFDLSGEMEAGYDYLQLSVNNLMGSSQVLEKFTGYKGLVSRSYALPDFMALNGDGEVRLEWLIHTDGSVLRGNGYTIHDLTITAAIAEVPLPAGLGLLGLGLLGVTGRRRADRG